eukprot:s1098_g10.t2
MPVVLQDVTLTPLHINTLLYNLLVGLKYLHSAGIYHRDLKPANCLVNQDMPRGEGDHDAVPGVPHTQRLKRNLTGHVVTRWYRAPELILLQENYTEAIDIWSVGCIYAELLGMLEGTRTQDRGPLFPGSSCFPLSPDHKHKTDYKYHTRGKHDQLNMIFNLLGTPGEPDVEQLEREDAKRYIRCFAARDGDGLSVKFPGVEADSIDILNRMLRFNPKDSGISDRIAVTEALEHRLFTTGPNVIRDTSRETSAPKYVTLEFEKEPDLDEKLLRKYFCKEIKKYHPEMPDMPPSTPSDAETPLQVVTLVVLPCRLPPSPLCERSASLRIYLGSSREAAELNAVFQVLTLGLDRVRYSSQQSRRVGEASGISALSGRKIQKVLSAVHRYRLNFVLSLKQHEPKVRRFCMSRHLRCRLALTA